MIELTEKTLDSEKITDKVRRDTNGAVVTFLGTTRDNFEGKTVVTLESDSEKSADATGRVYWIKYPQVSVAWRAALKSR